MVFLPLLDANILVSFNAGGGELALKAQSNCLLMLIPVTFETAWVLAVLAQANHIVHLCSGLSFVFRPHASSSVLGIFLFNYLMKWLLFASLRLQG